MPGPIVATPSADAVLRIDDLHVRLRSHAETVYAVNGVSLTLRRGRVLALVGESGSGKSMTVRAVMRLLPPAADVQGRVWLDQQDVLRLSGGALRRVRGRSIALAFQNASASLNPAVTVATHLRETLNAHPGAVRDPWQQPALTALRRAGIADAEALLQAYPFELSGGQQQRVAQALATVLKPPVLLADEITTGLDVTTQAMVLDQVRSYARENGAAVLLISHDLAVAGTWADDLAVMYAGMIVEAGSVHNVIGGPRHPYTAALIACQPRLRGGGDLTAATGRAETLHAAPARCPYLLRCPRAASRCTTEPVPALDTGAEQGQRAACYYPLAAAGREPTA